MAEKEKDVVISEEKMEETVSEEKTEEVLETEAEKETEEEASDAPEEADEESAGGAEKAGREKEKKGFRKKNREEKKTDALNEKIGELEDKVKRQLAEFENFRNRSEKEKTLMFEIGAKSVVEKILAVVDNFERGLGAVAEEEKDNAFVKGMEAVYKQFSTVLEEIGVVPIEAVGKEFDPNLHNAVMHVEDETLGENTVAEEFQKGYIYRETVVRHSMVKVAN